MDSCLGISEIMTDPGTTIDMSCGSTSCCKVKEEYRVSIYTSSSLFIYMVSGKSVPWGVDSPSCGAVGEPIPYAWLSVWGGVGEYATAFKP